MLEEIKKNFTDLVALYEAEKERADSLALRLSESEEKAGRYKEQITELNQQIDNLSLTAAFSGAGDNVMAKERIQKLIQEIDKCIRLLEK